MAKRPDDHQWAATDVQWVLAFFALLLLAGVQVFFLYVALAVLVTGAALAGRRFVLRRRRERANADAPHWIDRIKDS